MYCNSFSNLMSHCLTTVSHQVNEPRPTRRRQFEGKWYEVERSFYLLEIASSCTSLSFTGAKNPGQLKVTVKTVNRWTGGPSVSLGTASLTSNRSAVLDYRVTTKLPTTVSRMLPGAGIYSVLHTDYDTFAVLWSCSDLAIMHAGNIRTY
ncbi:unnamed protein product [Timema podura]|uniref:Apolipoprotein D n=1 Tax=Timema podura TaxID=61482 RepID=A0ABN7PKJ6_TIMPD|nr:unnamed protein product [Timema podura]